MKGTIWIIERNEGASVVAWRANHLVEGTPLTPAPRQMGPLNYLFTTTSRVTSHCVAHGSRDRAASRSWSALRRSS